MKIVLPGQDIKPLLPDGSWNPIWYEKLQALTAAANLFDGVAATITNGQTVLWDATAGKFVPGAN